MRLLFVFDTEREAIMLVAGDKAGRWRTWYAEVIPLAEERYAPYQRAAEEEEEEEGSPLGGNQAAGRGAEPGLGRSGAGCVARAEPRGDAR